MKSKHNLHNIVFSIFVITISMGVGHQVQAQPKDMGNEDFVDKEIDPGDWGQEWNDEDFVDKEMGPDISPDPSDADLQGPTPAPDVSPDVPDQELGVFPGGEDEGAMAPAILKDEDGGCSQAPGHPTSPSWLPGLWLLAVGMLRLASRQKPAKA